MTRNLVIAFLAVLVLAPVAVQAHGGGLNACGCHMNRKTGVCHCHRDTGRCGCTCEPESCAKKSGQTAPPKKTQ